MGACWPRAACNANSHGGATLVRNGIGIVFVQIIFCKNKVKLGLFPKLLCSFEVLTVINAPGTKAENFRPESESKP